MVKKLVIVGSGPAGFTAAIYAARANLAPILYEGFYSGPSGGQLMTTTDVENYPGFPDGITGPELMTNMRAQAIRFGTTILTEDVEEVELSNNPFIIKGKKTTHEAHSLIIATGATAKRLTLPGAETYWQKGVTACAVCDGAMPIFRDKPLFVVGGGDTAMEEALFLTKYGSTVTIIHRRDAFRASKIMGEKALNHPKINVIYNTELQEIHGENTVTSITLTNGEMHQAAGVFFAIGHTPNTAFIKGQLATNDSGYLLVKHPSTQTSIPGVFGAGDVADQIYRQAVTASGTGCKAALDAERYLNETLPH
ncbi:MAG: Thioredoxin reductase [Chlamydiia bacterium]|nr:Thioredoxin reductase [Chlamydiia bacterium]MCH9615864.1 Thioredoxin reductase [Chlamydiia bacterium]MCH9628733.1 Thioredoxin reductase [Chlamydiia bacterium]